MSSSLTRDLKNKQDYSNKKKNEVDWQLIGLQDNYFNLDGVKKMILTRVGINNIKLAIKNLRDIARLEVIEVKSVHGYRFIKTKKDEMDVIRLYHFFVSKFLNKTK